MSLHPCHFYQVQMKIVEDKLIVTEEKLKDAEDKLKTIQVETQRALDKFVAEARAGEDE